MRMNFVLRLEVGPPNGTLPEAPENVTGIPGPNRVTLTWERPADTGNLRIRGYRMYKGNTSNNLSLLESLLPDRPILVDTDVVNGNEYYYAVSAINWWGEGPRCPIVRVVPVGTPSEPLGLSAEPGLGMVNLTWSTPLDNGSLPISGFRLYRGEGLLEQDHYRDLGNSNAFIDMNVTKGSLYFYKVQAFNDAGNGSFSDVVSTAPLGLPDAPVLPRARAAQDGIRVEWRPPINDGGLSILRYQVHRGIAVDELSPYVAVETGTTFQDTEIEANVTYYYAISAFIV